MESISIMPYLQGHALPDDLHEFTSKIAISEDKFLQIIKDCMQYLSEAGFTPVESEIRYIMDLEEPDHQYLRVLFVLPVRTTGDAIKIQVRFNNEAYREILQKDLDADRAEMESFKRSVNIVFDIETN